MLLFSVLQVIFEILLLNVENEILEGLSLSSRSGVALLTALPVGRISCFYFVALVNKVFNNFIFLCIGNIRDIRNRAKLKLCNIIKSLL